MARKEVSTSGAIVAVVITILSWSSAYPAIRVGLEEFTPGQLAALRYLTASIVFLIVLAVKRPKLPSGHHLLRISIAGLLGIAVYNLALNTGELQVTAATASFLINVMPVFAALLGVTFLHEHLRPIGWFAVWLSFAGAAVIALGDAGGLHFGLSAGLILLAALCAAVMGTLQKPLLRHYPSISVTACLMFSGEVFLSPFLPGAFRVAAHGKIGPVLAAVFLGVFPAAIGYLTWAIVLSRFTLNQTASLLNLIPIVTIVISYFWIHEVPAMNSFWGGLLAITGIVILNRYGKIPAGAALVNSKRDV